MITNTFRSDNKTGAKRLYRSRRRFRELSPDTNQRNL